MEQLEPTYVGSEITDTEILDKLPGDYRHLLNQTNGFILFEGGLHVRGAVLSPEWHSLRKVWLGDSALHKLFPAINDSDVPFAQDCLGDQFVLRAGVVHKLDAEIGEVEGLGMNLEAFLNHALENPVEFLSLQPLLRFMSEGGELKLGQLSQRVPALCHKGIPRWGFAQGDPMFDRIGFLADFAQQIANIPKREI